MQYGNQLGGDGCHPEDGCQDGTPFGGSLFQYLAANVFYENTDDTILPPYEVHTIGGAKIAFIGLTFEDTPTVVTPSAVDGLDFRGRGGDGQRARGGAAQRTGRQRRSSRCCTRAAASGRPRRRRFRGSRTLTRTPTSTSARTSTGRRSRTIAAGLDPRVGVIISAHTHQPYICTFSGKLVTSAASFGRVVTDVELTIDGQTKADQRGHGRQQDRHPGRFAGRSHEEDPRQVHGAGRSARERGDRRDHGRHPLRT